MIVQNGHKIVSKRENWQNRYFTIVDGPQPHIAWYKDQKVFLPSVLALIWSAPAACAPHRLRNRTY